MDEQNIGTNAMGTAIKEEECVQITARGALYRRIT